MEDGLKSIVDLLDTTESAPPEREIGMSESTELEDSGEGVETRKLRGLPEEDKWARSWEYKMRGIPIPGIATAFGVDPSTVYRWLSKYAQAARTRLEQEPGANIIAESIIFYDRIEEMLLYEINLLPSDGTDIDSDSGKITRSDNTQVQTLKLKYMDGLKKTREAKIALMIQTGVLPKEPEHIYHRMEDEKRVKEEEDSGPTRTSEQVMESIENLLKHGRTLG